jgi:hypothetical protein
MSRGPSNFKERDVRSAVKAVREAGVRIGRIEINSRDGKVVIIPGEPDSVGTIPDVNEWDPTT